MRARYVAKGILWIWLILGAILSLGSNTAEAAPPWYYSVAGPNGSNQILVEDIGKILYFEFDSLTADYVWGNIRIDFDPSMLECVSLEETPQGPGFWTAWAPQTADPVYGGGGTLYLYDSTGFGSDWAQQWVAQYGPVQAGPVGSYDNAEGIIRLYAFTDAGGYNGSVPLRIGFRIKQAGTAVFTTYANDYTAFSSPPAASSGPSFTNSVPKLQANEGYTWRLEDLPYRHTSSVQITLPVVEVPIEVNPASCSDILNAKSRRHVPVAILGTSDFDITTVDISTIRLEGVFPLSIAIRHVGGPRSARGGVYDCIEKSHNGLLALVAEFDTPAVVSAIETALGREVEDGERVILTLTATLREEFGSAPVQGEDAVMIKKKGR